MMNIRQISKAYISKMLGLIQLEWKVPYSRGVSTAKIVNFCWEITEVLQMHKQLIPVKYTLALSVIHLYWLYDTLLCVLKSRFFRSTSFKNLTITEVRYSLLNFYYVLLTIVNVIKRLGYYLKLRHQCKRYCAAMNYMIGQLWWCVI